MGQEVKNHISCQSKHGLSDSHVKTGTFLPGGHRSKKYVLFWAQK